MIKASSPSTSPVLNSNVSSPSSFASSRSASRTLPGNRTCNAILRSPNAGAHPYVSRSTHSLISSAGSKSPPSAPTSTLRSLAVSKTSPTSSSTPKRQSSSIEAAQNELQRTSPMTFSPNSSDPSPVAEQNIPTVNKPPAGPGEQGPGPAQADSPSVAPKSPFKRANDSVLPRSTEHFDTGNLNAALGSSAKRQRPDRPAVKLMPQQYELCDVKDLVILISDMLMELVRYNDEIPLKDGRLTRFHSRAPPGISIPDYLVRLTQHATLSPPLLLSMVYYIDRLCALYPAFIISSLTVHRFLITAATVASKGLSDSFWTNSTYARVGGVSLRELALLELELLAKVQWRIVPKPEVLGDYYRSLIERSEGYEIEGVEDDQKGSEPTTSTSNEQPANTNPMSSSNTRTNFPGAEDSNMQDGGQTNTESSISSSDSNNSSLARLTVLVSGSGTNLQAIIDAVRDGPLQLCTIVRVISNRKAAYGLTRATKAGIPTAYHNLIPYKNQRASNADGVRQAREDYDADLANLILGDNPSLVVCAGFMHVLSPRFLEPLSGKGVPVINLHPALPGKFDGMNAIERAYEAFLRGEETVTGAMVHYVIAEVDRGEVILAREVKMRQGEGLERLTQRIHEVEWDIIVRGTQTALAALMAERERAT